MVEILVNRKLADRIQREESKTLGAGNGVSGGSRKMDQQKPPWEFGIRSCTKKVSKSYSVENHLSETIINILIRKGWRWSSTNENMKLVIHKAKQQSYKSYEVHLLYSKQLYLLLCTVPWILASLRGVMAGIWILSVFPLLPELCTTHQGCDVLPNNTESNQRHDNGQQGSNIQVMG